MGFIDSILGDIEKKTGANAEIPWWACDNCNLAVNKQDPGGSTCQSCMTGRLFKGDTKDKAREAALRSKGKKAAAAMAPKNNPVVPEVINAEVVEPIVVPEVTEPVAINIVAEPVDPKIAIAAEKRALMDILEGLGIEFSGRLGIPKLKALLEEANKPKPEPVAVPTLPIVVAIPTVKNPDVIIKDCRVLTGDTLAANEEVIRFTKEPVIVKSEEPVVETSAETKPDYKAIRLAATAAFIKKHDLSEFTPKLVTTAVVQQHGFTTWVKVNDKTRPMFRMQEGFETPADFSIVFEKARAKHPSTRIDIVSLNQIEHDDLKACLYNGEMLAGTHNSSGTIMVRRNEKVSIGALKTKTGHLRFEVLNIIGE